MNQHRPDAAFGWPRLALVFAATVFAGWFTSRMPTNVDVSWYITICGRLLSGAKMGVDVIETNPPASIWLYFPAVAFARAVSLKPEYAVIAMTLLTVALTCGLTWRLLRVDEEARRVWLTPLILGAFLVFCFLPGPDFAQREHFAAMLALPFVACAMLRARGLAPERTMAVAAGVCGGLVFVIKPHFGLALAMPVMLCFAQRRGWSDRAGWWILAGAEILAAGAVALLYAAAVLLFAGDYVAMLPLLMSLYVPNRLPFSEWQRLPLIVWAGLVLPLSWFLFRHSQRASPTAMLLVASIGFMAAAYVQGKGWRYHYYPAFSMGLLALVLGGSTPGASRRWKLICIAMLASGFAALFWWGQLAYSNAFRFSQIIAGAKSNPTVVNLTSSMHFALPAVRDAGGVFVGSMPNQWLINTYEVFRARDPVEPSVQADRDRYRAWARDLLLKDIRSKRPDLLIVQIRPVDWLELLTRDDPEFAAAMADYHPTGPTLFHSDVEARLFQRAPAAP